MRPFSDVIFAKAPGDFVEMQTTREQFLCWGQVSHLKLRKRIATPNINEDDKIRGDDDELSKKGKDQRVSFHLVVSKSTCASLVRFGFVCDKTDHLRSPGRGGFTEAAGGGCGFYGKEGWKQGHVILRDHLAEIQW